MIWGLIVNLIIYLIGFYYVVKAFIKDKRLDIFLGYVSVLLGISFSIIKIFYSEIFFLKYYSIFLEHIFGIMGAGIIFMFSCYFAKRRIDKVLE